MGIGRYYLLIVLLVPILISVSMTDDVYATEYATHENPFYNIGIEIAQSWKIFADIDKSEFPERTYYSRWYDTWSEWIHLGLQHNAGQSINLENFNEVTQYFEDYQRKWCADTEENPIFFDVPVDTGFITCLKMGDFTFKQVTIDGRQAYQVSYQWDEMFVEKSNGEEVEFGTWQVWGNLIPYGDDLIVVIGEVAMVDYQNVNKQREIITQSIDTFKILNDGKPIFDQSISPDLSIKPTETKIPTLIPILIPTLIPIPTPTKDGSDIISLAIDQSRGVLQRDFLTYIKIFGQVEDYLRGVRITLSITDPEETTTGQKIIATKEGYFETYLWFDDSSIYGVYKNKAQYREEISQTSSFKLISADEALSIEQSRDQLGERILGTSIIGPKELTVGKITYEFAGDCKNPDITESDDAIVSWGILIQKIDYFRASLDEGEIKKVTLDCNNGSVIFTISSPRYDSMTILIKTPDYRESATIVNVLTASANGNELTPLVSPATGLYSESKIVLALPVGTDTVEIKNFKILPKDEAKQTQTTPTTSKISTEKVPGWIKKNAKWWADGMIGEDDFLNGIQHMIKEKMINIPDLPSSTQSKESDPTVPNTLTVTKSSESSDPTTTKKVPGWIKKNAKWWADGLISEDDFLNGIKHLIKKGIIKV